MPKHHIAGAAALLLATAPAAWAEIDAQTIWTEWQDLATRFGGTMTAASEEYAGGTLTLTDVSMAADIAGSETTAEYGTVTMIEQDDGTVRIELPESVSTSSTTNVDGTSVEQVIDMTLDGADIVARDEDGVRVYDIAMDAVMAVIATGAEDAAPTDVNVTVSNIAATNRSGLGGDPNAFDQSMTADRLLLTVSAEGEVETENEGGDAESGAAPNVDVSYVLTGITSQFEGTFGEAPAGPVVALSDLGMSYDGEISHSGSTLSVIGEGPQGPFSVASTSGSGKLTLEMGEETMGYIVGSNDIAATIEAPGLPVPIGISLAESTVGVTLPLGASEVASPFAFAMAAREIVLDDAVWGLFDPTGQLPRDPATLVVDLDGTVAMNVDLFGDPAAAARLQGPPGDVRTLKLNQLLLSLAGAELRGSGTLKFPETKPVPEPVGTIELALDGGFALADKLVALGFIPQEQATFVKGLAGAVTRSVGDDQLETTIEFLPGGGISANGLPLK